MDRQPVSQRLVEVFERMARRKRIRGVKQSITRPQQGLPSSSEKGVKLDTGSLREFDSVTGTTSSMVPSLSFMLSRVRSVLIIVKSLCAVGVCAVEG